jgi:hypothetical protein
VVNGFFPVLDSLVVTSMPVGMLYLKEPRGDRNRGRVWAKKEHATFVGFFSLSIDVSLLKHSNNRDIRHSSSKKITLRTTRILQRMPAMGSAASAASAASAPYGSKAWLSEAPATFYSRDEAFPGMQL